MWSVNFSFRLNKINKTTLQSISGKQYINIYSLKKCKYCAKIFLKEQFKNHMLNNHNSNKLK